jgi:hypothetical protein
MLVDPSRSIESLLSELQTQATDEIATRSQRGNLSDLVFIRAKVNPKIGRSILR